MSALTTWENKQENMNSILGKSNRGALSVVVYFAIKANGNTVKFLVKSGHAGGFQ